MFLTSATGEIVPFFGLVISLLGALTVSIIVFIFPVAVHLKLRWKVMTRFRLTLDLMVLFFGVMAMMIGIEFSLRELVQCIENPDLSQCK